MVYKIFNFFIIFCFLIAQVSCNMTNLDMSEFPPPTSIVGDFPLASQDVGNFYDTRSYESFVHRISRTSAVRVQIEYPEMTVYGSGTYVRWKGHDMVVTAFHLFAFGGGSVFKDEAIITSPNERVFGKLVYIDELVDIAVFAVPALKSRKPSNFSRARSYKIGDTVVYSGFPGPNQLLTFDGTISGEGNGTDIAIHSFAWPGSSGSGVYNSKGELVGVVVSIMVGGVSNGSQLIGSIVYIAPATLIDSARLWYNLDRLERNANAGF